jgi:hypothetical protein
MAVAIAMITPFIILSLNPYNVIPARMVYVSTYVIFLLFWFTMAVIFGT